MAKNWEWRASGLDGIISGDTRILEIGAGRGFLATRMRKAGRDWTACDPCQASPGIECAGLPVLPYADREFDCTVSVDVLEHLAPEILLPSLQEMRRVARRGAWAVANMSEIHMVNGKPVELHLIQQPADWWVDQVRSIGGVCQVHATDTTIRFWLEVTW